MTFSDEYAFCWPIPKHREKYLCSFLDIYICVFVENWFRYSNNSRTIWWEVFAKFICILSTLWWDKWNIPKCVSEQLVLFAQCILFMTYAHTHTTHGCARCVITNGIRVCVGCYFIKNTNKLQLMNFTFFLMSHWIGWLIIIILKSKTSEITVFGGTFFFCSEALIYFGNQNCKRWEESLNICVCVRVWVWVWRCLLLCESFFSNIFLNWNFFNCNECN